MKKLALLGALALALAAAVAMPATAQTKAASARASVVSSNPLNAIGQWANADVDAAIGAATKYPDVQDQVGAACLAGIKTLAAMVADHPLPVTLKVATDIEYARLIQGELNILCRNPSCAQVWGDMANAVQALSVGPLPFSFTSICAKVPIVGLTLGAPAPAATSAAAAK